MDRTVYLSADCSHRLSAWLAEECGCRIEFIHTEGIVAGPVSDHPDMFMCRLGAGDGAPVIRCRDLTTLSETYPYDIPWNAACTGRYFIHNLRYTAPQLLHAARESGCVMIDVRQGYAKCSTVIVDEDSVITYDRGIAGSCLAAGMNVLTVRPGHVLLPGYDTGFIGGASGRVGDTVIFNGDLSSHPDFDRIVNFISSCGLRIKWFEEWPLTDIGSIY